MAVSVLALIEETKEPPLAPVVRARLVVSS